MTEPLLRTAQDIVEAYRRRVLDLGITYSTVDAISGLPDGYTAKLLAPTPMKTMSRKAIELLNGALAMGFVVAVDPAQQQRVEKRWVKRKRPFYGVPLSTPLSITTEMQVSPELQQQLTGSMFMKSIGKLGGKRRMKTMSKRARQRAASHAARMRWAKKAESHAE